MRQESGNSMNRDQVEGKVKTVKGQVKQAVGDVVDDPVLHDEGVADEAEGRVQDGFGKAKQKVGKVVEDIGKAIKK